MTLKKFSRVYPKAEVIFEEGSQGAEMFVVVSGKVRLSTKSLGHEVTIATLGPGEFFGEMSLIDGAPRSATATADAEETKLVALDTGKFLYLISQQPAFALTIMHALCRFIRERGELYSRFHDSPPQSAADAGVEK